MDLDERVTCEECDSVEVKLDARHAELVCVDCGLIQKEKPMDRGPEWRAYNPEDHEKNPRGGEPLNNLFADKGLTTTIARADRDHAYRHLNKNQARVAHSLRKWQRRIRVRNTAERNQNIAANFLGLWIPKLPASPSYLKEDISLFYKKAAEKGIVVGRSIEAVTAASLYHICGAYGLPVSMTDIAKVSGVPRKQIRKTKRAFARKLQLFSKAPTAYDFVERTVSHFDMSLEFGLHVTDLLDRADTHNLLSGKSPLGAVGAAVYITSLLDEVRIRQKDISAYLGVTEVTIRNRYKEQVRELDIELHEN